MAALPTQEQNATPGADAANDVVRVEGQFLNANVSTATTTTVKNGSGFCRKILVLGGTLGNVTVYDNTAASGAVLVPTVTPVANGVLLEDCVFNTGLTIVTAAATVIVVSYR